jgi:hypothetical protein
LTIRFVVRLREGDSEQLALKTSFRCGLQHLMLQNEIRACPMNPSLKRSLS